MSALKVQIAVYGALYDGKADEMRAVDVTAQLQAALDSIGSGIVTINNSSMGGDPCKGYNKSFGAVVALDGIPQFFACAEGQKVDFFHSQPVADENELARNATN